MSKRTCLTTLAFVAAAACAIAPAAVAATPTVAYIDGDDLWFASADGTQKRQITTTGTSERPFQVPSQAPDGTTVAAHKESFDGGRSERPVLYRYGPDGKLTHANVMPVSAGAGLPVYPMGLDMDWNGQAVAYGYSYCGFACTSLYRGYWLTFSDNQGAYPSNPQGQSDAFFPTFYGKRVISSDSGGSLFVQPDVAEAPFTNSYQGWISGPDNNVNWRRAEVAATGRQVALEWYSRTSGDPANGIYVGQHTGAVPGDVQNICSLPTVGAASNVTFSYDGTLIAWQDGEGVKVAGAPNLAAGTPTCTLSAPPRAISATGKTPHLGGADPAVWAAAGAGTGQTGTPGTTGGTSGTQGEPGQGSAGAGALRLTLPARTTRATLRKGLALTVTVPAAGRIDASATVPSSIARRLHLRGAELRVLAASGSKAKGGTVVARGRGTARTAGPVKVTLRLTAKAKRRLSRMRGVTLRVRVSQGAATAGRLVKVG